MPMPGAPGPVQTPESLPLSPGTQKSKRCYKERHPSLIEDSPWRASRGRGRDDHPQRLAAVAVEQWGVHAGHLAVEGDRDVPLLAHLDLELGEAAILDAADPLEVAHQAQEGEADQPQPAPA